MRVRRRYLERAWPLTCWATPLPVPWVRRRWIVSHSVQSRFSSVEHRPTLPNIMQPLHWASHAIAEEHDLPHSSTKCLPAFLAKPDTFPTSVVWQS